MGQKCWPHPVALSAKFAARALARAFHVDEASVCHCKQNHELKFDLKI
jgi:hypothetical protein